MPGNYSKFGDNKTVEKTNNPSRKCSKTHNKKKEKEITSLNPFLKITCYCVTLYYMALIVYKDCGIDGSRKFAGNYQLSYLFILSLIY